MKKLAERIGVRVLVELGHDPRAHPDTLEMWQRACAAPRPRGRRSALHLAAAYLADLAGALEGIEEQERAARPGRRAA